MWAHPPISLSAQQDCLARREFYPPPQQLLRQACLHAGGIECHYGDSANYLDLTPSPACNPSTPGRLRGGPYAVDGCGAPCFISDLSTLARTWLSLGDLTNPIISRIKTAMCAQPWYYSGTDRLDYTLAVEGRGLLTKVGAAGLLGDLARQRHRLRPQNS